ncbi:hypothetical protein H4CHR_05729 [Variovorax sp. PBS-H4]|uniref:hypothetical protein n=1 Tax=Variovorax sp. PBS-H4 TaxID=434008 RepID=UPI001316E6D6|nr:hypothetical protein [Variovorax sp. PBS-H4]VTU40995.1 hypothetical protein H4CHR_05729 [Variovorax sp. PBS-H4]
MTRDDQSRFEFTTLVEGLFRESGEDAPILLQDTHEPAVLDLRLHGTDFVLGHDPDGRAEEIFVEVSLGPLPQEDVEAAMRKLLTPVRHLVHGTRVAAIGFNPDDKVATCGFHLPLHGMEPSALVEILMSASQFPSGWREAGFVQGPQYRPCRPQFNDESFRACRAKFISLVEKTRKRCDWAIPLRTTNDQTLSFAFDVHDIPIALLHGKEDGPETFEIRCSYGPVSHRDAEAVLLRLLELNRFHSAEGQITLHFDQEANLVFASHLGALDLEDDRTLSGTMQQLALSAMMWRQSSHTDSSHPAWTLAPHPGSAAMPSNHLSHPSEWNNV